jgi:hypothetical protein
MARQQRRWPTKEIFHLDKKVKHTTKGSIFDYFKSFYVDDAAFIIMNKEELQEAHRERKPKAMT